MAVMLAWAPSLAQKPGPAPTTSGAQPAPGLSPTAIKEPPCGFEPGPVVVAAPVSGAAQLPGGTAAPTGVQRATPQAAPAATQTGPGGALGGAPKLAPLKTPTELKAHPMIGAIGDTVPIKATLKLRTDGTPVPNHTVRFKVGGQSIGTDKTDAKGEARVSYKVPNQMGQRPIEAEFAGTQVCTAAKDDATFSPIKSSSKMTLELLNPNQILHEGNTLSVKGRIVRITDQDGLDGREIQTTVAGQAITPHQATSASGSFSLTYKIPGNFGAKTATVEARFDGDALYLPTVASISFTVHPPVQKAYLLWGSAKGKVGETVEVTAILSKSNPPVPGMNGIDGKSVRFWRERDARWAAPHVPAKTLGSDGTNSLGVAKLQFKIEDKPMGYSIYAHVDGVQGILDVEKLYNSSGNLTVEKAPVQVSIVGPSSAKIGDSLAMKVKVTRTTDGAAAKDVAVTGSGIPYGSKTNAQGEVAFTYQVGGGGGIGPRTLSVQAQANDWYLAGSGSKTIQVGPKTN
jgi:hypothetical protein